MGRALHRGAFTGKNARHLNNRAEEGAGVALELFLVALGGMLGGLARALVSTLVAERFGDRLPWGTFAVNLSGSLALGLLAGASAPAPLPWLFLGTGILGSYTTVSTFSLQTLFLLRQGAVARAALNTVGSASLCIGAAAIGFGLAAP